MQLPGCCTWHAAVALPLHALKASADTTFFVRFAAQHIVPSRHTKRDTHTTTRRKHAVWRGATAAPVYYARHMPDIGAGLIGTQPRRAHQAKPSTHLLRQQHGRTHITTPSVPPGDQRPSKHHVPCVIPQQDQLRAVSQPACTYYSWHPRPQANCQDPVSQ